MMKVKFLGAAGTVTGSSYLVTANSGEQILIDLGLYQGPQAVDELNFKLFEADVAKLAGVVLTHAHLDHCGRLPMVEKMGFSGKVFMTAPTAELVQLTLLDAAKIAKEDHPDNLLYDETNVFAVMRRFQVQKYDEPFMIGSFRITLRDAGHIIGACSVEVKIDDQTIVFSGDLGNSPEDLTRPTTVVTQADIVVMESTYGDRLHPTGEAIDVVRSEINTAEKTNSCLLIPAFSLERTQELLHIISHLKANGQINQETPIYLDSPMAEKATNIYEKYKTFLNDEIAKDFVNADPFAFPGLQVVRDRKESSSLNEPSGCKVIIAGSGMMTGGRIVDHARFYLPVGSARFLIVGYQGEGTLGRELLEGKKDVMVGKQMVHVNAVISETQVMSSHADQTGLMTWLRAISGIKQVVLTHGEDKPRKTLAEKIKSELRIMEVRCPGLNDEVEFTTGK
jgi:metallo-beta-lactamase family protein